MSHTSPLRYIWIDFESPGIDPAMPILEACVIGTDAELRELFCINTLIRPTKEAYAELAANPIVIEMHSKSGLYSDLVNTDPALLPTLENLEDEILRRIEDMSDDGEISIAGSGVSHYDADVIETQMPRLHDLCTYYQIDVNTQRRMYKAATGHDIVSPLPEKVHRAETDIRDDLRYARAYQSLYREHDLKIGSETVTDRAMSGLALIDAFARHQSIDTRDGELYTRETATVISGLLATTGATDVIWGLMHAGADLLERLAIAEGSPIEEIVESSMLAVLADGAGR